MRRAAILTVGFVALTAAFTPLGAQGRAGVPTAAPMTPAALRTRLEAYTRRLDARAPHRHTGTS